MNVSFYIPDDDWDSDHSTDTERPKPSKYALFIHCKLNTVLTTLLCITSGWENIVTEFIGFMLCSFY